MGILSAEDIFEFAIKLERNGEYFYRKVAEKFEDMDVKKFLEELADEEVGHRKIFEKMEAKLGKIDLPESYPGEFYNYMESYMKNIVFPVESIDDEIEKIANLEEALDYAIRREMDSILYYKEIKELVPDSEKSFVDGVINEERCHFIRLSEKKRKI